MQKKRIYALTLFAMIATSPSRGNSVSMSSMTTSPLTERTTSSLPIETPTTPVTIEPDFISFRRSRSVSDLLLKVDRAFGSIRGGLNTVWKSADASCCSWLATYFDYEFDYQGYCCAIFIDKLLFSRRGKRSLIVDEDSDDGDGDEATTPDTVEIKLKASDLSAIAEMIKRKPAVIHYFAARVWKEHLQRSLKDE